MKATITYESSSEAIMAEEDARDDSGEVEEEEEAVENRPPGESAVPKSGAVERRIMPGVRPHSEVGWKPNLVAFLVA